MKQSVLITIVLVNILAVHCQVPFLGNCPDIKPKQPFDVSKVRHFTKTQFFIYLPLCVYF